MLSFAVVSFSTVRVIRADAVPGVCCAGEIRCNLHATVAVREERRGEERGCCRDDVL